MSTYLQSFTSCLHDKDLLSDTIKEFLRENDNDFNGKPSVKINFGKCKGKTVSEVPKFDKSI